MMNDRFSASLRQHLLDTANERAADGQLAAILERVADTPQRHPLGVRLARFPGRIGPFPSTAVRWALIAAALLAATMAVSILGGGPTRSTVFEGTWTSTDPGDGSSQILTVAPGMTPAVHFEDNLSTGGACVADEVKVFIAEGTGQIFGGRLTVAFPDGGGCGLQTVDMGPGFYDYDEATDRLTDGIGLTWFRAPDLGGQPMIISSLMIDAPSGADSGTFETSGAASEGGLVCPSGVVTDLVEIDSEAIGRGELVDFTVPKQFACDDGSGTFAVTLEIHVNLESGTESFSWVIVGGTDAYEGLRGEGYGSTQSHATDKFLNTYWGSVRTDRGNGPATEPPAQQPPESQPPATQPPAMPAPTPVPDGDARCIDLHGGGGYGASVGSLTLTATLPSSTSWQGLSDGFLLSRMGCPDLISPVWIEARVITQVYTDLCDPAGANVDVDSSAAAMAILQPLVGLDEVGPTDVTLGGYAGRRLDFYVRPDFGSAACPEGSGRAFDGLSNFVPERNATVHLLDVDGTVLALVTYWSADMDPDTVGEVDAIVASLRVEP